MSIKYTNWKSFGRTAFSLPFRDKTEKFKVLTRQTPFYEYLLFNVFFFIKLYKVLFDNRDGKLGTVGIGEISKRKRVQCPYCKEIQKLKSEKLKCQKCRKQFYLFR